MPRNPNATRPNANIGPAKLSVAGITAETCPDIEPAMNISTRMSDPVQNAEKLPATRPLRMPSDAPPWSALFTISSTCRLLVDVKNFVNSGMSAPAAVPQEMMIDSTHHRFG